MILNPKIFEEGVEKETMRKGYGRGLLLAGEENKNVVALSADLLDSTETKIFADKFPERYFEVGVAEQNLAAVASGMAAMGKIPFIASYAIFSPGRNWEQVRTTICYNNANVKIIGSHVGVSVGPDGGSHQALEDIAITRVLPRMTVISPCDAIEAEKAVAAVAKINGPVYIRLCREKTPIITSQETPFEIGKARVLYVPEDRKPDVVIIATGALVYKALLAARELESENIFAKVVNLSTIKPLDKETILACAKEAGAVVTVEEHQRAGGMGSAVAEFLAEEFPVPIEFVAVEDEFGQSGNAEELLSLYRLGKMEIQESAKKAVRRKVIS